jgi:hypothetical protein
LLNGLNVLPQQQIAVARAPCAHFKEYWAEITLGNNERGRAISVSQR